MLDIATRVAALERRIEVMGGDLRRLLSAAPREPDGEEGGLEADLARNGEHMVRCMKCDARLLIYSPSDQTLRLRVRDVVATVYAGDMDLSCRRCGATNRMRWNKGAATATSPGPHLEIEAV